MYSVFLLSEVLNDLRSGKILELFRDVLRDLKCCGQRIGKGFCYRDIWSIDSWFVNVIPDMLIELRDTSRGFPTRFLKNDGPASEKESNRAFAAWKAILTQMAFLFREANEETCRRKNPYEEEYLIVLEKFRKRFGYNGKQVVKKDGTKVFIHDLGDIPKYKALYENYHRVEREISEYRLGCRKKALSMFTKYFDDLWD